MAPAIHAFGVDWGTTRFRLWAFAEDGGVVAERQDDCGAATLKPAQYEAVLESAIAALQHRPESPELNAAPDTPVVICGMAGAVHGWREAPYLDLPAALTDIAQAAVRAPTLATATRRDVRILPGVAQRDAHAPDVMRGEETQLLGAVLQRAVRGVVCLPGTHSKWAQVEAGVLSEFHTAMTGEVFALLANHSTLAPFASSAQTIFADAPVFSTAVREAIDAPQRILNALFSVRAGGLLATNADADADTRRARLSGLLIGVEIAGMKKTAGGRVTLIAEGALADNYRYALKAAEIETKSLNVNEMARVGLYHAAQSLWAAPLRTSN